MVKWKEILMIFCIGAVGYSVLEILWRGYTHWTMTLTGGFCFLAIYAINGRLEGAKLWKKCLAGAVSITAVEFAVGMLVNRVLLMDVWDYSNRFCTLFGQICLLYSVLWFFLCIPLDFLCRRLRVWFAERRMERKSSI